MRSAEYWAKRAERNLLAAERTGAELTRSLIGFYSDTGRRLQKEMDAFYGKYAVNNAISLEDASKRLTATELKSFKEELRNYHTEVKRIGLGKDYAEYLRELSARSYISRQQELFAQTRHQVELLFGIQEASLKGALADVYYSTYYHTIFDVQQGLGIGADFARLNTGQIENLIKKPWLGDNYSSRVWQNKTRLLQQLERTIPQAFATGENSRVLGRQLADRMGVSARAGERLVRTEVNHAANTSTIHGLREAGVEYYQLLATLDLRTSDACQSLDGKIFRVVDAIVGVNLPPIHPNCRSTIIPWFPPDEFDGPSVRAARGADGSYYTVPGNMTYKEWYDTHVNKAVGIPASILPLEIITRLNQPGRIIANKTDLKKGLEEFKQHVEHMEEPYKSVYTYYADNTEWVEDSLRMVYTGYDPQRDAMVFNSRVLKLQKYQNPANVVFSHEFAHRFDYLSVQSWKNEEFLEAIQRASRKILNNVPEYNALYGKLRNANAAYQDILSALSRNKIDTQIGHPTNYWTEQTVPMEIFANVSYLKANHIDIPGFDGLLDEIIAMVGEMFEGGI